VNPLPHLPPTADPHTGKEDRTFYPTLGRDARLFSVPRCNTRRLATIHYHT